MILILKMRKLDSVRSGDLSKVMELQEAKLEFEVSVTSKPVLLKLKRVTCW